MRLEAMKGIAIGYHPKEFPKLKIALLQNTI
jgi:hypothetical protein